jgi:hypothetical protein
VADENDPKPPVAGVLVADCCTDDAVLDEPKSNVPDEILGVALVIAGLDAAEPKPNNVCDGGGIDGVTASAEAGGKFMVVDGLLVPNAGTDGVMDPNDCAVDDVVVLLAKEKGTVEAAIG